MATLVNVSGLTKHYPVARTLRQVLGGQRPVVRAVEDVTFSLAVSNVFDEDPPLARLAEGYDAMTSDPLGRTIRTGLRVTF